MNIKIVGRRELRLCSSCASNYSLSAPKWVLSEVDNIVPKSNIWQRGRSFSSSVPSREIEPRKSYKRVSKDARQTMVESFVKEYQSVNEGKFPTASHIMKQVGGSYYVLRSILQELERKSTALYPKNRNEIDQEKKPYKESECLILTVDKPSSIISVKEDIQTTSIAETKDKESGVDGDKHLKTNSRSQNSTQVERTLPAMEPTPHLQVSDSNTTSPGHLRKRKNKKASYTPSKMNDNTVDIILDNDVDLAATGGRPQEKERLSHLRPKIMEDDKTTESGKDSTKFEHIKKENRQPEASLDAAEFPRSRETSVEQSNDSDLSKKTLWGNLRSFADGIINLWRKR